MVGLSESESLSVLGEEQLEQGISAHEKNRNTMPHRLINCEDTRAFVSVQEGRTISGPLPLSVIKSVVKRVVGAGGLPADQFVDTDKDTDMEPSLSKNGCSDHPKKTRGTGGIFKAALNRHRSL